MIEENSQKTSTDKEIGQRRSRDFLILTLGAVAVLTLLLLTSAIGLVEWITGGIVMLAGSLAYFVGSQPPHQKPVQKTRTEDPGRRKAARDAIISLVESFPFPCLIIGDNDRISMSNASAEKVFRIDSNRRELAGGAIRQPDLLKAVAQVTETGLLERVEFTWGEDAVSWQAHLIPGPEPKSVLIILEDLTGIQQAERARADFLANASHELRTPLTAIGGFIETIQGPAKDDPEAQDRFLKIIQQQTERMKRLVADLLSLSRIEFSEHRQPSTRADMREIVLDAATALSPLAKSVGLSLDVKVPDGEVPIIGDRDELIQVVQNLVSNALKYAPGSASISVTLGTCPSMLAAEQLAARQIVGAARATLLPAKAEDQTGAIYLRVQDQGDGIQAQHLPRLGQRFYRADESRGGEITGTGLGLAIVKHIVARHRGGFGVESLAGEATAFGVWMPALTRRST